VSELESILSDFHVEKKQMLVHVPMTPIWCTSVFTFWAPHIDNCW